MKNNKNQGLLYNNRLRPMWDNKEKIWLDEVNSINELNQLASLLGLNGFEVLNSSGQGFVYTANDGHTLMIENCDLKLIFNDSDEYFIVKDKEGNKTTYNTNEVVIWQG